MGTGSYKLLDLKCHNIQPKLGDRLGKKLGEFIDNNAEELNVLLFGLNVILLLANVIHEFLY